jgi:hypothetical protein
MEPTTSVKTIIDKASLLLNDKTATRWPVSELLGWLNDGQRELVMLSPQANTKHTVLRLSPGVKQSLPVDGIILSDIPYNLLNTSSAMGASITRVPREVMTKRLPGWATSAPNITVKHYIYALADPLVFYVYPPQPTVPGYIECIHSALPDIIQNTSPSTKITIADFHQNALLDYLLYRAFIKDSDSANQVARGMDHYKLFIGYVSSMAVAAAPADPTKPHP